MDKTRVRPVFREKVSNYLFGSVCVRMCNVCIVH
jgi:hypothetical protein